MKTSKALIVLVVLIAALALVAAGVGVLWQGSGNPYPFTTLRGETVMIHGRGLYHYDTVSGAAQVIAGDVVTLFLGIPLLVVSLWLYTKRSLRGALLLAGTLGYFLYTYASIAFLAAFNALFLVYVALFSLSLFAFILSLMSIDVAALPARFSTRLPRRGISAVLFLIGAFLLLAWLGRIVPALLSGAPPFGLESYATLVIQALDLGLIVPLALLAGVLLLKERPFGYLLTAVALLKGLTMATAVSAMAIGQVLAGVPVSLAELVIFPGLALANVVMAWVLLSNVSAERGTGAPAAGVA